MYENWEIVGFPNSSVGVDVFHLSNNVSTVPLDASYDDVSFIDIGAVCGNFKKTFTFSGNNEP